MMSAIENLEARKEAAAEVKPAADFGPATEPTPAPEKKPTPATTSARNSNPYTVALTLDPHVYHHFEKLAKQDDRTIAKFIARHLRATCPPEGGKPAAGETPGEKF
jgi:hypothetical protein